MPNNRFKIVVLQDGYVILTCENAVTPDEYERLDKALSDWRKSKSKALLLPYCDVIIATDVINAIAEEDES